MRASFENNHSINRLGFLFTPDLSLASSRASIVATINSDMITALQLEKNVRLALLAKGVDPNKVSPGELKDIKNPCWTIWLKNPF